MGNGTPKSSVADFKKEVSRDTFGYEDAGRKESSQKNTSISSFSLHGQQQPPHSNQFQPQAQRDSPKHKAPDAFAPPVLFPKSSNTNLQKESGTKDAQHPAKE